MDPWGSKLQFGWPHSSYPPRHFKKLPAYVTTAFSYRTALDGGLLTDTMGSRLHLFEKEHDELPKLSIDRERWNGRRVSDCEGCSGRCVSTIVARVGREQVCSREI